MIAFLFSKVGRWIALAVGLILLAVTVLASAKRAGRQAERVDQMRRTLEAMEKRNAVERDTGRLPAGAAAERLRNDWSRD